VPTEQHRVFRESTEKAKTMTGFIRNLTTSNLTRCFTKTLFCLLTVWVQSQTVLAQPREVATPKIATEVSKPAHKSGLGQRLLAAGSVRLLGALAPTSPNSLTTRDLSETFNGKLSQLKHVFTELPEDTFEGVTLELFAKTYMDKNCQCTLRFVATNKYQEDVPLDQGIEGNGLLAFRKNGSVLKSGDRGPLRLVFSAKSTPADKWRLFERWSVWEIASIEFLPLNKK
jgi:hypothetical protein